MLFTTDVHCWSFRNVSRYFFRITFNSILLQNLIEKHWKLLSSHHRNQQQFAAVDGAWSRVDSGEQKTATWTHRPPFMLLTELSRQAGSAGAGHCMAVTSLLGGRLHSRIGCFEERGLFLTRRGRPAEGEHLDIETRNRLWESGHIGMMCQFTSLQHYLLSIEFWHVCFCDKLFAKKNDRQGRIQTTSKEGTIRNQEALHHPTCSRPHPPTS